MATNDRVGDDRREVSVKEGDPPPITTADENRTTPHAPAPDLAGSPLVIPPAAVTAGGRYEVGAVIARGGMGAVHAAVDRTFDREVAVKLVREEYVGTAVAARFFVEARIMGQLQHPGIPPVHDVGALPDGRPYLVMKLIKGRTLSDLLRERATPGGELDRFLPIFEQVCLAVAFAHARGVLHRDLKPDNVMVGAFGEVQVMDWGLAKGPADPDARSEAAPADVDLSGGDAATRHGTVLGTLAYMPPEQARGEIGRLDARSDVFGLGAILCVILTGKPPHAGRESDALRRQAAGGDMAEALERVERSPAPRLVSLLAMRCLAPDPADRPAHAGEVAASLRSVMNFLEKSLRESEVEDATAHAEGHRRAAGRRGRTLLLIGLAGLLVGGAAAGISQWNAGGREEAARRAVVLDQDNRRAAYRELFPLALDGLARDVNAGLFKQGRDRDARERSARRVAMLLGAQEPRDQARGYLALAAAATPDDRAADLHWQTAVKRYKAAAPAATEVDLACEAVRWDFPEPLRPAVLRQARDRLQSATHKGGLEGPMRTRVREALTIAETALEVK